MRRHPAPPRVAASPSRAHGPPAPRASPLTSAKQLIFGRKIGEGTQGEVRLARHATTGKRYVVKILDLDDPDDPDDPSTVSSRAAANDAKRQVSSLTDEEARAVETEADCLRMLSHPNVVRCHGTFRLDPSGDDPTSRRRSRLCIVMSHCEGGDLATLLARTKGQPLPEDAVMRWLVQLLLALDHVHSKNVLHRDLKPANVFLSKNLRCVKIGDFGIAKALEREDDLAVTRVGTPLYMSPELVTGQPYTYASDVWALGCVAYELASGGKRAFARDSLPQLMCKVMTCDYPPVPSHFSRQRFLHASWDRCWTRTRTSGRRRRRCCATRSCAPTPKRGSRSREVRARAAGEARGRRASPRGGREGEGEGEGRQLPLPGKVDPPRAREIHRGSSPEGLRWIARSSRTPAREPPGPSPTSSAKFAARKPPRRRRRTR